MCIKIFLAFYIATSSNAFKETTNVQLNTPESKFSEADFMRLAKDCFRLDILLIPKISKRHFFGDIQNSSHGVADIGLEPHQKNFFEKISTNMVARGIRSFGTLGGAADLLIE